MEMVLPLLRPLMDTGQNDGATMKLGFTAEYEFCKLKLNFVRNILSQFQIMLFKANLKFLEAQISICTNLIPVFGFRLLQIKKKRLGNNGKRKDLRGRSIQLSSLLFYVYNNHPRTSGSLCILLGDELWHGERLFLSLISLDLAFLFVLPTTLTTTHSM